MTLAILFTIHTMTGLIDLGLRRTVASYSQKTPTIHQQASEVRS
jgi:hypothetical protein